VNRFRGVLRHYLLISLTISFITGILLQHYASFVPPHSLLWFVLLLPTILLFEYWKKRTFSILLLLLFVATTGFLHAENDDRKVQLKTNISSRITQEQDSLLVGTLHSMPIFNGKNSTVILKSHYLRFENEKHFSSVHGLVQIRLKGKWPQSIVPGDELILRTRLSRPYAFGNPGGFDYPAFLDSKNIKITGRINSTAHIHTIQQNASYLQKIRYLPERIRLATKQKINSSVPEKHAAIYRALLIGDRSGLNKEQLELFKGSGTFHILAISGLHLSIIASTIFVIFYWLLRRSSFLMLRISCKKLALLASILPLCCFALLAGFQTPVFRSLLMVIVFILSFCIQRQRSPFTTLASAALIILLITPKSLFTVSFQLSFTAVTSLIFILPKLHMLVQKKGPQNQSLFNASFFKIIHWGAAALLVSIAATVGTAPLLIYYFNRFSLAGPIANLLIEPLLCLWSLPIGLFSIPFLFINQALGEYLLHMGGYGITVASAIATFLTRYTYSTLWFATPSIILILLYYLILILSVLHSSRKTIPILFIPIWILFFYPPQTFFKSSSLESELVFLDVGQGSSTLLTFPGGKKVLIDGGGSSSEKFNVGESIIAPYLWSRGIIRLNSVVITHPDSDHFNGVPFILKRFNPEELWINGESGHDQEYDDLLTLAADLGITIKTPIKDQVLIKENNAVLQTLFNPFLDGDEPKNYQTTSSNDHSLVLKYSSTKQKLSCLFPGDISAKGERGILKKNAGETLQSTLLLSPHHGSKTSNSPVFLGQVTPDKIVVSAGRFQPHLFPSQALRQYCKEKSIPLLNTSKSGAITVRTEKNKVIFSQFNLP